jgi:hypothetical protein
VVSAASTAAVVWHAFHTKKQFYPAVVAITNSNLSMLVWRIFSIPVPLVLLHAPSLLHAPRPYDPPAIT